MMNECISWMMRHKAHLPVDSIMLDVGAYHGEFAEKALQSGTFSKAWLFEPNRENLEILRQVSFSRPVEIVDAAVSDSTGSAELHYDRNFATGSLLPYCETGGRKCNGDVATQQVIKVTLDDFFSKMPDENISLIKVDAQGADLRVVRGATRLIAAQRPWLVVEMLFVPLYKDQGDPREIWDWFALHDYVLAGFFDAHYSSDDWLCFADAVFVPRETANAFLPPFHSQGNTKQEAEIANLRQVCEERLELIKYLHNEAEKRLVIIMDMERQLDSYRKQGKR